MATQLETDLREAERKRCAAMLANDAVALDALLDERLCFSHATGLVDDKPAYMAKMAAGRIIYLTIGWSEERVIELAPGAAILSGRMVSRVTVESVEKMLDNRVLTAWTHNGAAWRLAAFQSTPLKA